LSNDTSGCTDDIYFVQEQGSTSGMGIGAIFNIVISFGTVSTIYDQYFEAGGSGSGYAIGDTMTIYGSDYGGKGSCVIKVEVLVIDGFLINLEKDNYEVKWYNLVINGNSPTSLSDAQSMLAAVLAPAPPTPPNPSVQVNPPSVNTFDIPEYLGNTDSDFTIEWLQYMHTDDNFPRVYSIGQYPAQNAVSIERDTLYLWLNGSIKGSTYLPDYINPYLDTWVHIVITRSERTIYIWGNGTLLIEIGGYTEAIPTNGNDFYIGSENAPNTYYNGLISNFRWCTGIAVYSTDSPTYPIDPLAIKPETILLTCQGDSLGKQLEDKTTNNTITASGVTYNADSGISRYDGSLQFGTI